MCHGAAKKRTNTMKVGDSQHALSGWKYVWGESEREKGITKARGTEVSRVVRDKNFTV